MDETAYETASETDEPRRPREDFRDGTTPLPVAFRPLREECNRRFRFDAGRSALPNYLARPTGEPTER